MARSILYLNEVGWIGGAERVLLDLVAGLDKDRFRPVVICPEEGELPEALRDLGISTHIVPFYGLHARNPLRYLETIARIYRIARRCDARLIHVNQQYFCNYGIVLGRVCRLPVIVHLRGVESDSFFARFIRWIQRADKVVCISRATQSSLLRYALEHFSKPGINSLLNRLCIIYDGMQYIQCSKDPALLRQELGIAQHAKVIGIVGQVVPEKGLSEFVDAARIVSQSCPNTHFLVVGDDPDRERNYLEHVRARVSALDIGKHFTFTGFRRDATDLFRVMEVSVLASWSEAFGRTVLESQAAGVPVVAANVGGVPEIVEDGISGILVPSKDSSAFAQGILRVLNMQQNERLNMIEEGRQCAGRFSIETHVEQIQDTYENLLMPASKNRQRKG